MGGAIAGGGGAATATGVGAAPGIPARVGGVTLALNGLDNAQAGLRTVISGEFQHTLTAEAAGGIAEAAGANPETARPSATAPTWRAGSSGPASPSGRGSAAAPACGRAPRPGPRKRSSGRRG